MLAERYGNVECVKLLLYQPDININEKNKYGHTALVLAEIKGRSDCLMLLNDAIKRDK